LQDEPQSTRSSRPGNILREEFQTGGHIDSIAGKLRNASGKSYKNKLKS
jgi:hypothetical protein